MTANVGKTLPEQIRQNWSEKFQFHQSMVINQPTVFHKETIQYEHSYTWFSNLSPYFQKACREKASATMKLQACM
jgi:hypothetical protein